MKAINEHFEVGQQYYALVSKEVLVVSEVLQPGMCPSGSGGYHTLRSPMVRFRNEKTGLVHTCSLELAKHLLLAKRQTAKRKRSWLIMNKARRFVIELRLESLRSMPSTIRAIVRKTIRRLYRLCTRGWRHGRAGLCEYDPDKDLLQTVVYGDCASDEPTAIVEHYNTDF